MGLFYGNEIKCCTNAYGTEMISYIVKSCDEKMQNWLVSYFQDRYGKNKKYTIKFWNVQSNPGNECVFCFDKPQAPSLRRFIKSRGPLSPAEAETVISALITALAYVENDPYQCLTPDTVFYDADTHCVQILPVCPAGRYEFSSAPLEIAPEAWKSESWSARPSGNTVDVFSVGVLYMELVAGSTDWSSLNDMLSARLDFPETIIRCCSLLPALRPSLSELFTQTPTPDVAQKRSFSVKAVVPKSNPLDIMKRKLSGFKNIFDEDDDFSEPSQYGSDNETR